MMIHSRWTCLHRMLLHVLVCCTKTDNKTVGAKKISAAYVVQDRLRVLHEVTGVRQEHCLSWLRKEQTQMLRDTQEQSLD